ncbi:MAG: hypothetical protein ACXWWU_09820, partial [Candidatus Limnocylindria bacterium]
MTAAPGVLPQLTSRLRGAVQLSPLGEAAAWSLLALVVYWVTGPPVQGDMWPPLAEAFLDGKLYLVEDRPWLELVPRIGGGQYVPLPPVPALFLLPFALVMDPASLAQEIPGNVYASIVGAANVGLAFWLLRGWGVAPSPQRWLTFGFAFTTHWWVAGMAGPHHFAEVTAVFFALISLNLAVRRQWPVVGGLALGLAAGSRLPVGLALPAVLALYGDGWRLRRSWIFVLSGLLIPVLALAAYNIARFGSPIDFGYAHIPSGDEGLLITDEPWFTEGLMSISYIPRHLEVMFIRFFDIVAEPPFLRPNLTGASLLLTAPFIFWSLSARGRLVLILWDSVILVILPDLMWGTWGFAQFGYRRILDVMPLLLLLLGIAFRERIGWFPRATILFGAAV